MTAYVIVELYGFSMELRVQKYRRLGLSAHALVGTIAKIYALHNEVRYIRGVKG